MKQLLRADASQSADELLERDDQLSTLHGSLQVVKQTSQTNLGRAKADGYGIITQMTRAWAGTS